jgi:hypothetical protein
MLADVEDERPRVGGLMDRLYDVGIEQGRGHGRPIVSRIRESSKTADGRDLTSRG